MAKKKDRYVGGLDIGTHKICAIVAEITDEGRVHLAENQPLIDDIFSRIAEFAQSIFGEPMMDVHRAMKNVGRAVYASKSSSRTAEQIAKIKEILNRAATEIEGV